jgi:hypothetical protein
MDCKLRHGADQGNVAANDSTAGAPFPVETIGFATSLVAASCALAETWRCQALISLRGIFFVFDKSYFEAGLPAHIKTAGAEPTVEVHLLNGQGHRVRSVIDATDGYVVLEAYQRRAEITGTKGRWQGKEGTDASANEVHHAIVSYDSISQVVITPTESVDGPRIGFGAR